MENMKTIIINNPYTLPVGKINGIEIVFPYQIITKGKGMFKDKDYSYEITIGISAFLLISWGYRLWDNSIIKDEVIKLAFPFAIQFIKDKIIDESLKEFEEVILTTENIKEYPYDLNKIDKINGYTFQVENDNPDIGHSIKTNQLADDIITTRDNINALMMNKFKSRLHNLVQERYILDLYRTVGNSEEFTHRISSVANLIGDLNIELLREITEVNENKKQTLDLLELFFKQNNKSNDQFNEIIKIFRKIRKVRQSYPIHTDTVSGLIEALNYLGIEYPIKNYNGAWNRILELYRKCLHDELLLIKEI